MQEMEEEQSRFQGQGMSDCLGFPVSELVASESVSTAQLHFDSI